MPVKGKTGKTSKGVRRGTKKEVRFWGVTEVILMANKNSMTGNSREVFVGGKIGSARERGRYKKKARGRKRRGEKKEKRGKRRPWAQRLSPPQSKTPGCSRTKKNPDIQSISIEKGKKLKKTKKVERAKGDVGIIRGLIFRKRKEGIHDQKGRKGGARK